MAEGAWVELRAWEGLWESGVRGLSADPWELADTRPGYLQERGHRGEGRCLHHIGGIQVLKDRSCREKVTAEWQSTPSARQPRPQEPVPPRPPFPLCPSDQGLAQKEGEKPGFVRGEARWAGRGCGAGAEGSIKEERSHQPLNSLLCIETWASTLEQASLTQGPPLRVSLYLRAARIGGGGSIASVCVCVF